LKTKDMLLHINNIIAKSIIPSEKWKKVLKIGFLSSLSEIFPPLVRQYPIEKDAVYVIILARTAWIFRKETNIPVIKPKNPPAIEPAINPR
jgi:hypothetical protein